MSATLSVKSGPQAQNTMQTLYVDAEDTTLPPSTPAKSVFTTTETEAQGPSKIFKLAKVRKNDLIIPEDTFVFKQAEKGEHRSRFRILPYSRESHPKYSGSSDKLTECIKRGGGLVINRNDGEGEGQRSPTGFHNVIKILDVEFVRANIKETKDMILPYDCFNSNFIWNQIYQRSQSGLEKKNADLNMFRVSPSAHAGHDANGILHGTITWNDVPPISSDRLSPAIRIKDVALQMFPELIVCPNSMPGSRTRRVYSRHESQTLLDKICEVEGHHRVLGVNFYQDLAETYSIGRSGPSLKEHFRKTILPHVLADDGYYTINPKDLAKFQKLVNKGGRSTRRTEKKRV